MSISVTFKNRFKECVQEYCAGHGDCGSVRLAEKMGISYSVYSRILQYGILPKPDVLVRSSGLSGSEAFAFFIDHSLLFSLLKPILMPPAAVVNTAFHFAHDFSIFKQKMSIFRTLRRPRAGR